MKLKMKNPYETLGLNTDADEETIKKAYRIIAKKYHPDMNPNNAEAEKKFKEASEAYAILSDPQKRKAYDSGLIVEPINTVNDLFRKMNDIVTEFQRESEKLHETINQYEKRTDELRSQVRKEMEEMEEDDDIFQTESFTISRKRKKSWWKR